MNPPDAWQVETDEFRLLVLLSADQSWLRLLAPLVPVQAAQNFLDQILEANFDKTQEARYALHQNVLWGVFHHELATLTETGMESAINRLQMMKQEGVDPFFNVLVEQQIRQIIQAAKLQRQSLEETMKTLNHFYSEGMMGDMSGGQYQDQVLEAWRRQLERLWPEVD
ncbi:MAG: hypothetical protein F6K42_39000 [Leptolyngbya sp. SIO1D8]|nr:hypothetical protein [Leptolyngbya sp. SIO1D8]